MADRYVVSKSRRVRIPCDGPRMSNRAEVDQHFGEAYRPKPVSLEQVVGRKVRPSEDEDLDQKSEMKNRS